MCVYSLGAGTLELLSSLSSSLKAGCRPQNSPAHRKPCFACFLYAGFEQVAVAAPLIGRDDEVHRNPAMRRQHTICSADFCTASAQHYQRAILSRHRLCMVIISKRPVFFQHLIQQIFGLFRICHSPVKGENRLCINRKSPVL